jgi:hypothetical protein
MGKYHGYLFGRTIWHKVLAYSTKLSVFILSLEHAYYCYVYWHFGTRFSNKEFRVPSSDLKEIRYSKAGQWARGMARQVAIMNGAVAMGLLFANFFTSHEAGVDLMILLSGLALASRVHVARDVSFELGSKRIFIAAISLGLLLIHLIIEKVSKRTGSRDSHGILMSSR